MIRLFRLCDLPPRGGRAILGDPVAFPPDKLFGAPCDLNLGVVLGDRLVRRQTCRLRLEQYVQGDIEPADLDQHHDCSRPVSLIYEPWNYFPRRLSHSASERICSAYRCQNFVMKTALMAVGVVGITTPGVPLDQWNRQVGKTEVSIRHICDVVEPFSVQPLRSETLVKQRLLRSTAFKKSDDSKRYRLISLKLPKTLHHVMGDTDFHGASHPLTDKVDWHQAALASAGTSLGRSHRSGRRRHRGTEPFVAFSMATANSPDTRPARFAFQMAPCETPQATPSFASDPRIVIAA